MAYYTSGHADATAGTEITSIVPPNGSMIPVLVGLSYRAAADHDLFVMRCRGTTTTHSFTASGDTTMELAKNDPGRTSANADETLAASDWVCYQTRYGNLEARKISSISGSTITIAATTDDVDEGAKVYAFYEAATSNVGAVHFDLVTANSPYNFDALWIQGGIPNQDGIQMSVSGSGMPILVVSDNATTAGDLDRVTYTWIPAEEDFLQ